MKRQKQVAGGVYPPIRIPKRGYLRVLGIARVSRPKEINKLSLKDQGRLYEEWLKNNCPGTTRLRSIATQGSGEWLDRAELKEIRLIVRRRKVDLVLTEDLGRFARRIDSFKFAELCEDMNVRLIALNDHLDTAKPDWRNMALFAAMRHEQYNADTAARIRRTQRSRFQEGKMLAPFQLFCYHKPRHAKHDSRLEKIEKYAWVVEGIIQRLEEDWTYWEVADWLNENKIPTGPGCKTTTWLGYLVKGLVFNPLLKGKRLRNAKRSRRRNGDGRRRSERAPKSERLYRKCPHLAFVEPDRYDRLIAKLTLKNANYKKGNKANPRETRRTRWPSGHAICAICHRSFVNGGHGVASHLMCNGARLYKCWNSATFERDIATERIPKMALEAIVNLPDFDEEFLNEIEKAQTDWSRGQVSRRSAIEERLAEISNELHSLVAALSKYGQTEEIDERITNLKQERTTLRIELDELPPDPRPIQIPKAEVLRQLASDALVLAAKDFKEFNRIIRRIIPVIHVFPVRRVDGGQPVMRAKFRVRLSRLCKQTRDMPKLDELLSQEFIVDLFEQSQPVALREEVMKLRAPKAEGGAGLSEAAAANKLGITKTAAQRAAALDRLMRSKGVDDPFQTMSAPPDDFPKWKRHRHPRYQFAPLADVGNC